ncbi:MAG: DUF3576 domain-containing protein [Alphaproteobacteria bacterium]|nr:DUF3576 domain-containing protein [Alphaproteobacteria bacterium]
MSFHYRLPAVLAASLSLMLVACGSTRPAPQAAGPPGAASPPQDAANLKTAADTPGEIDTEATIWTVLGLAKKPSQHPPGPHTGNTVSPILWQAARDTLSFVKFTTEDPLTGELVTDWYSPKGKPNERYKIDVFVLARTLRSDAVAVTIDRQELTPAGQWTETTVARKVEDDLEAAILRRAGQLKREWIKAYAAQ